MKHNDNTNSDSLKKENINASQNNDNLKANDFDATELNSENILDTSSLEDSSNDENKNSSTYQPTMHALCSNFSYNSYCTPGPTGPRGPQGPRGELGPRGLNFP